MDSLVLIVCKDNGHLVAQVNLKADQSPETAVLELSELSTPCPACNSAVEARHITKG